MFAHRLREDVVRIRPEGEGDAGGSALTSIYFEGVPFVSAAVDGSLPVSFIGCGGTARMQPKGMEPPLTKSALLCGN